MLRDYCKYADSVLGKWAKGPESKGHVSPNVRAVAKPLLGMFMGQRGSRRWKQAMDEAFRRNPATLTQLLDVCSPLLQPLLSLLCLLRDCCWQRECPPDIISIQALGQACWGSNVAASGGTGMGMKHSAAILPSLHSH